MTRHPLGFDPEVEQRWIDTYRCGFLNQTETTIAFDGTNTFTLAPVGDTWHYWRAGIKYEVVGSKTVVLPGTPVTTGTYYIYIDATDGTLSQSTTAWTLEDSKIPVAIVIFNNSLTPKFWMADERHTCLIDRRMHLYEHATSGTEYISGGTLSGYVVDGTTDADLTFAVAACTLMDEDIIHTNSAIADPGGVSDAYTILYRTSGSTWAWKRSPVPFMYTGTGYIQYDNAGAMTASINNRYVNSYAVQTNLDGNAEFVIIPGQAEFTTLAAAQAENPATFTFTGLPVQEFVITYRLTWATNSSYTTKGKVRLDENPSPLFISAVGVSQILNGADHGSLTGLTDPDHPASAITTVTTNFNGALSSADDTSQKSLDTLDDAVGTGWILSPLTWTYASASTFTIAGDYTSIFVTGTKIKLTQTTVKYFYVVSSSYSAPNTTVTVTGGSDYTIANATITSPYYSQSASVSGFPSKFAYAPTWGGFSSNPTAATAHFSIVGRVVTVYIYMPINDGTSNSTAFTTTGPVTATMIAFAPTGRMEDNTTLIANGYVYSYIGETTLYINKYDASNWTASGKKSASFQISYTF